MQYAQLGQHLEDGRVANPPYGVRDVALQRLYEGVPHGRRRTTACPELAEGMDENFLTRILRRCSGQVTRIFTNFFSASSASPREAIFEGVPHERGAPQGMKTVRSRHFSAVRRR